MALSRSVQPRVLVINRSPVCRAGLVELLSQGRPSPTVSCATDLGEARALLSNGTFDVAVIEGRLVCDEGAAEFLEFCRAAAGCAVMVFPGQATQAAIVRAVQRGVHGYVLTDAPCELVRAAVAAVASGGLYFCPEATRLALADYVKRVRGRQFANLSCLTPREQDVLRLLARGYPNKQVADVLGIGIRTVETHRERIRRKLDLNTPVDFALYALHFGLIGDQA